MFLLIILIVLLLFLLLGISTSMKESRYMEAYKDMGYKMSNKIETDK
jgi:hypothetical protein